ncbi:MAG: hypothetical protein K6A44_03810 [bacterium]|nr:hypothetical protein [bacterium]
MPAHADENDGIIVLKSVSITKQPNGQFVTNIVADKKFPTPPLLFEKTKNTYFVSLPATKYDGNRYIDVSSVADDIDSVTVDFIPYKSAKNSGYTRIIIVTKHNLSIVVKESLSDIPKGNIIVIVVISGILILGIAYLAFALYSRLMRKRHADVALEEYTYSQDGQPEAENPATDVQNEDMTFEEIEAKVESEKEELLTGIFESSVQTEENDISTDTQDSAEPWDDTPTADDGSTYENSNENSAEPIEEVIPEEEITAEDFEQQAEPIEEVAPEQEITAEDFEQQAEPIEEVVPEQEITAEDFEQQAEPIEEVVPEQEITAEDFEQQAEENELEHTEVSAEQVDTLDDTNDIVSEESEIAAADEDITTYIESPDNIQPESQEEILAFTENEPVNDENIPPYSEGENSIEPIQESDETQQLMPSADEIVSDILGSENALNEISESIIDNASETFEDTPIEQNTEDLVADFDYEEKSEDELEANTFSDIASSDDIEQLISTEELDKAFESDNISEITNETTDELNSDSHIELVESDDMLDEILDDIQESIEPQDEPAAASFDDIISGNITQPEETAPEPPIEDVQSQHEENDFTLAEVQHISSSGVISGKTFDFTAAAAQNTQEQPQNEESTENIPEEVSPFEELGFTGMMAGDEQIYEDAEPVEDTQGAIDDIDDIDLNDFALNDEEDIASGADTTDALESFKENLEEPQETVEAEETTNEFEAAQEEPEPIQETAETIQEEPETVQRAPEPIKEEPVDNTPITKEEILAAHIFEPKPEYLYKRNEYIQDVEEETSPYETPSDDINTGSFFSDSDESVAANQSSEDFFVEDIEPEEALPISTPSAQASAETNDDNEPIVLDKKDFTKNKSIYLLRHKGEYSLVAIIGENVFVVEKFESAPSSNKIILKHNEKRANDDIYITKVGSWRALVSVSKDNVKNILTL